MSLTGILLGLVITSGAFALGQSAKENKERNNKNNKFPTKTNIALQNQIAKQMSFILSKDLNVIKPEVTNLYDYICDLRVKYGLPPNDIFNNPIRIEVQSKACALSEKNKVEEFFGYRYLWLTKESFDDFINENIRKKYTIEERIAGIPYYDRCCDIYPSCKNDQKEKIKRCSLQAEMNLWYIHLWQEIMLREMRMRGYALSYDGIHGTPEEEKEKQLIEDYKNAVKYPWTVTPGYLKTAERELIKIGVDVEALRPIKPPVDEEKEAEIDKIYKSLSFAERIKYSSRFNGNQRYQEDPCSKSENRHFLHVCLGILISAVITLIFAIIFSRFEQTEVVAIIFCAMFSSIVMGSFCYGVFFSDAYCKPLLRAMQKDYYEYPSDIRSDLGKEYALLLERLKNTKKKK